MNKKQQTALVRQILYKYSVNQSVTDSVDQDYLMELFPKHPEWNIKLGAGISDILVRMTPYNTRCFSLVRTDGTETDISFVQCINGKTTPISDIKVACRTAIRPEITRFRRENVIYGQTVCQFTGEILTEQNTHVDHYQNTFDELFQDWISGQNVDELFRKLNDTSKDQEMAIYFVDQNVISDFVQFHNQNTHLRVISKRANLSILRRN